MRIIIVAAALLAATAIPSLAQTPEFGSRGARRSLVAAPVVPVVEPRPFCREGRTSTGECVNPRVAQLARLTACIHTQGLLSVSGGLPCTTVFQDDEFRYPNAVYADTKRALDIALNRRASSLDTYSYGRFERVGPGTPNPPRYPVF